MEEVQTGFSVTSLILHASFGVQFILLILLAASIVSWKLIFEYNTKVKKAEKEIKFFKLELRKKGIDKIYSEKRKGNEFGIYNVFNSSFGFFCRNSLVLNKDKFLNGGLSKNELIQREDKMIDLFKKTYRAKTDAAEQGLKNKISVLGTISATAPYVGLLGTVYGILIAFWGLGMAQQATIATVAPSIAEALIATGMGLFVAIPSLVAYNRLNHRIDVVIDQYEETLCKSISKAEEEAFNLIYGEK